MGPMCSGKTYAATHLFEKYSRFSLAAPLKQTASYYFKVTGKTNDERRILQELADDIKKWDNDVFTKLLLWDVYDYYYNGGTDPVIVDDLRFTHEANDLREHGFTLVRVTVPDEVRQARIAEKYPDTDPARFEHRSEKDYKNIKPHFTILGEGTEALMNLREILLRD
jgi:hypothetical protein